MFPGDPQVRAGLQGKAASRMTQWQDSIALSASAPIRYQDKVVGVVLTGLLIDRGFLESLSRPGAEVAMFYGDRLVVNSFKDLPESALSQFQRHRDLAVSGKGPVDQVQRLQLGKERAYTITYLPLEEGDKPWESLIVVGVDRRIRSHAADAEAGHLRGAGRGRRGRLPPELLAFLGHAPPDRPPGRGHPESRSGGVGRGYPGNQPG